MLAKRRKVQRTSALDELNTNFYIKTHLTDYDGRKFNMTDEGPSSNSYIYCKNLGDKEVIITREYIEYNDKRLEFEKCTGIRFGKHILSINNIESINYTIHLTKEPIFFDFDYIPPKSSITIPIEFTEGPLTSSELALEYHDVFNEITQILFNLAVLPLAQKMLQELFKEGEIRVGGLKINQNGIIDSKKGSIKWSEYRGCTFQNGEIEIMSSARSFLLPKHFSLSLKDTWNANFLHILLDSIVKKS